MRKFKQLLGDKDCDVAIIGGGMAGILSAYSLAKAGKKVTLLEKSKLLSGATSRTTAFITHVLDTNLSDLVDIFDAKNAKLIWNSHVKAIDYIEEIVKKEKVDCDFTRCDSYSYANTEKEFETLENEYHVAKKLGFKVTLQKKNNLNFPNAGYLLVKQQAKFDALKFASEVAAKAEKYGAIIYENTEVKSIEGKPLLVRTKRGNISCKDVVVATYQPFNKPLKVFAKKGMYKSYVFKVEIPKGLFPQALYEDQENPYHYFRVDSQNKFDQLTFGGEDHRIELKISPAKNFKALEKYLQTLLGKNPYKIITKWSGPILEPTDGIALIGRYKPHQFLASAFSGNGMTYSAISAIIFRDLITGKENSWTKIYDPKRKPSLKQLRRKGKDYAQEFFDGAVKNIFQRA